MDSSSPRPSRTNHTRHRRTYHSHTERKDRKSQHVRHSRPERSTSHSTGSRFIYPDIDSGRTARFAPLKKTERPHRTFSSSKDNENRQPAAGYRHRADRFNRGGRTAGNSRNRRARPTFDVSRYINLNPSPLTPDVPYEAKHTFNDFGLDLRITAAVEALAIETPSAIQDQIIPHIMNGHDVVGLAQTGTGKTAAFLLPTIHKTLRQPNRQTLILAPTRELAIQVEQELRKLTPKMHLHSTVCVGGMNIRPQIMGLKRKNHFIIGTPGRVQDLIDRGNIKPGAITTVILDEADRMLDMGFIHDIKRILKDIPTERETLFFSATMSKEIESLISDFLREPITVSIKKNDIISSITQDVIRYEHHNKFDVLVDLLKQPICSRVIIFGAMKHSVEKLSQELVRSGIKADAIHGNKSHGQRQRALGNFKLGRINVLVATDVAARGIHVDDVSHVINYDLPNTYEDYVHRIGRTGRGSKRGQAITFVTA